MVARLLLIDDCEHVGRLLSIVAERYFPNLIELEIAQTLDAGLDALKRMQPDAVLLDYRLKPYDDCSKTVPQIRAARFGGPIHVWSSNTVASLTHALNNSDVAKVFSKMDFHGLRLRTLLEEQLFPQPSKKVPAETFGAFSAACA